MEDYLFLPSQLHQKKVLLYGSGSSARYFIEHLQGQCELVAITDAQINTESLCGLPCFSIDEAMGLMFDYIVVASWAISDISQRLKDIGAKGEHIYWFQHNKNRVVEHDHNDALSAHREFAQEQVLYAFYDLDVARATFDVLGFLCLAEAQRQKLGCDSVHVVVVNASNNDFNIAARGIISTNEHIWRKRQILAQSCGLLPSCHGFTLTTTKEEAASLLFQAQHVFPHNYSVEQPIACWEFDQLFKLTEQGEKVAYLQASLQARQCVQQYLDYMNPAKSGACKKVVTVTIRESHIKPARNSLFSEWCAFLRQLDKNIYFPVILPDTDRCWSENVLALASETGCDIYRDPCFNVELRMALYELSHINLGVNNGPMHLCALSSHCRYIMYKQVTEDYAHTSTQSFLDRGFTIGADFAGANAMQKLVWQDDTFDVIKSSFDKLDSMVVSQEQNETC
ncbi:hypothetical protein [Alteromonas sp. a30]|uniref:hypothetical protein n=1 Tax=Alteromonas sp. a30 TaxID=2730917 RepID=UPI002280A5B3|nr:hypothetical protein [Alteromonas sp. a30]MCY7294517.1 hypothetical protein [Alteromonas sp. a30]